MFALRRSLSVPLNLEMANHPDIVRIALRVKPAEVCLVPEKRRELTTEGGLDVSGQFVKLLPTVRSMERIGVKVSLFVGADERQLAACSRLGAPFVELHTGSFCDASPRRAAAEIKKLIRGASFAHKLGLGVNAGHGINMGNIERIMEIPYLNTLNVGHSIVARAVFVGLDQAVSEMLQVMRKYRGDIVS